MSHGLLKRALLGFDSIYDGKIGNILCSVSIFPCENPMSECVLSAEMKLLSFLSR